MQNENIFNETSYLIDYIVNIILNKKFTTKQLWYGEKIISQRNLNEEIVEPNKEFKGILTDFVIKKFIDLSSQTELFLKTIVFTFEWAINKYKKMKSLHEKSIFFVYKGGNVLRIIAEESEKGFPGSVSEKLRKFYEDSFKKSDADFSIYIDPKLPNFKEIFDDMVNMTFLLENHLRNIFMSNPSKYFQFYRLNFNEKLDLMLDRLQKLNESDTVKNKLFKYDGEFDALMFGDYIVNLKEANKYEKIPKGDFEIGFENRNSPENIKFVYNTNLKHIHQLTQNDPLYNDLKKLIDFQSKVYRGDITNDIFLSLNGTTVFPKGPKGDILISFHLVRSKFPFNANFTFNDGTTKILKLDGELIDVSIINKDYSTLNHFYENIDKYIKTYTVGTGDFKFEFKGYSLEYLVEDLEFILFKVSELPWNDSKYVKRIKRLLYLYFVMLMINSKFTNSERLSYLNSINEILNKTKEYTEIKNNEFREASLILIDKFIKSINDNYGKVRENPFGNYIKKLVDIILIDNVDFDQFLKFILNTKENVDLMIETINSMNNYISKQGTLDENEFYKPEQLGGRNTKEIVYLNLI